MEVSDKEIRELEEKAREIRKWVVRMTGTAGSGHPGGSLSEVDILTALYFKVLRHDPKNPNWPHRDRFILSKGHGCPALYAALALSGYFPVESLLTLRKLGSPLQGHPDKRMLPVLEASTGSLGQGLSIAIGMALAGKLDGKDYRIYALMGDGESQEGQVWEAAMFAGHHRLDNLTAILDYNEFQLDDALLKILSLEPLTNKWRAFNWHVIEVDGHHIPRIIEGLQEARETVGKPSIIIAHTVKGKGVSFMERNNEFHGKAPTPQQVEQALKELESQSE